MDIGRIETPRRALREAAEPGSHARWIASAWTALVLLAAAVALLACSARTAPPAPGAAAASRAEQPASAQPDAVFVGMVPNAPELPAPQPPTF